MKRAILEVNGDFLDYHFIQHTDYHVKVEHGLPDDAKFCACHYDHRRHVFELIYESEEFEDILEGAKMPVLPDIVGAYFACEYEKEKMLIPQYEP